MRFAKDKLEWLEYDLLKGFPEIAHGTFLRHGGTSEGPFASLNASDRVGDHPDNVHANRELILSSLGLNELVFPNLEHGNTAVRIISENASKKPSADAVFTTEKNIGLAVTHADCQGALLYDPDSSAIAAVHAGWKGSVQNVYEALITAMKNELGTNPKNLLVTISPSLGPDHAEFKNFKTELPENFWSFETSPMHFNFWDITRMQLSGAGVPDKNIEMAEICSFCTEKDYFSARREKKTGRNVSIIGLKS